jgi:hypothetical protein
MARSGTLKPVGGSLIKRTEYSQLVHLIQGDMVRLRIVVILLAGILGGCANMTPADNQHLQEEIAKTISTDMSFSIANQKLVERGFSCDYRVTSPVVSCTRIKDNVLLSSCMQRVNLKLDLNRQTLDGIDVVPIACAEF